MRTRAFGHGEARPSLGVTLSSDDSSSDQDSCGTGSTSREANDIFDTLDDHLGYGSDSGSGW